MKFTLVLAALALLISVLSCAHASTLSSAQRGLTAMKVITGHIKRQDFASFLNSLSSEARVAIPMTASVYRVVKDQSISKDSKKQIRDSYNLVENQMTTLTSEFGDVKRRIDWSAVQVNYAAYELQIRAAMHNLKQVLDAPFEAQQSAMQYFITKYETDFGNAGVKIYDGVINKGIFVNNLILAARRFTTEHRRQVRVFGMGLTQLLFQAIEVEMAYSEMKFDNPTHTSFVHSTWEKRINEIKQKLSNEDNQVTHSFASRQDADKNDFLHRHRHLSNKDFAQQFYNFMSDKYDWRTWFVVAYRAVSGWQNHAIAGCGGGIQFRDFGRNLAYASQDLSDRSFNKATATSVINSISVHGNEAKHVMEALNRKAGKYCSPYAFRASVCWGCDVWYIGRSDRFVYRKVCAHGRCTNNWLFG